MATSMKKEENPAAAMRPNSPGRPEERTSRRVQCREKKWERQDAQLNDGSQGGGKSRAVDAHIQQEDEAVIPGDIEDTAGKHGGGGETRTAVIAQEGGEQLIEQKDRHREGDRTQVFHRQREQGVIGAEQPQHGFRQQEDQPPAERRKPGAEQHSGSEEAVLGAVVPAAPGGGKEDRAADAGEQSQAVNDVPDGREYGQSGGAVRPLVLSRHGGVHQSVDGADHGTAEGGAEIAQIDGPDISGEKIHDDSKPLFQILLRTNKKEPDKQQAFQPDCLSSSSFQSE